MGRNSRCWCRRSLSWVLGWWTLRDRWSTGWRILRRGSLRLDRRGLGCNCSALWIYRSLGSSHRDRLEFGSTCHVRLGGSEEARCRRWNIWGLKLFLGALWEHQKRWTGSSQKLSYQFLLPFWGWSHILPMELIVRQNFVPYWLCFVSWQDSDL